MLVSEIFSRDVREFMMMDIQKFYDEVIYQNYDLDCFQLLNQARMISINQIQGNIANVETLDILDLAVGTGETILALQKLFPQGNFYGIDISQKMLDIAKSKLPLTTFHDDSRNIAKYLEPNSIDIALTHFVFSYVAPEEMIAVASQVLRPHGLLSIASSTYLCFQKLQAWIKQLSDYNVEIHSHIPHTPDELNNILNQNKFEIVQEQDLRVAVNFSSFDALYNWGMKSGWLTHFLCYLTDEQISVLSSTEKAYFPLLDEFQASILLLRKI